MATTIRLYTVEDLAQLDGDYELDRGMLVPLSPGGRAHSVLCARVLRRLADFVEERNLGEVTCNDPGFVLERGPDTLRGPDVAFVSAQRLPPGPPGRGFTEGAPDLAIEVVGEASSVPEAMGKAAQYLEAGALQIWLLDIARRRVLVFSADGIALTLSAEDVLEGGSVLPGFTWPVGEIFAPLG